MTVRKRGKSWQAQVRIKEAGKLVYSESATRDTKAAATLWKLQAMEEIKQRGWRSRKVSTTTVRDLLERYAQERGKIKKLSRGFEHSMSNVAYGPLGEVLLTELTSAAIVEWAMTRHQAGNAPATVMHHLATLSAAIRAAKGMFDLDAPAEPIKLAIDQLKRLRVAAPSKRMDNRVTDADLEQIMPHLDVPARVIPMREIVNLAVEFPRRREELLTLERQYLAEDGSTIKLIDTKHPSKYREEVVPVPPKALEMLRALPAADSPFYLPYKPESVSAAWQRAVRRAGLPHLRFHDLRHEGISRLFEQGLTIEEVAMISGHTSWTTLKRYTHLRPQQVTEKLRNARTT